MTAPVSLTPWYLTKKAILVFLTLFGPLALPLVWLSPRFDRRWKVITTIVTLVLAVVFGMLTARLVEIVQARLAV